MSTNLQTLTHSSPVFCRANKQMQPWSIDISRFTQPLKLSQIPHNPLLQSYQLRALTWKVWVDGGAIELMGNCGGRLKIVCPLREQDLIFRFSISKFCCYYFWGEKCFGLWEMSVISSAGFSASKSRLEGILLSSISVPTISSGPMEKSQSLLAICYYYTNSIKK